MNKRQIELLNLCGYKIDSSNKIKGEKDCIASMFFDDKSKMFSIKIKSYAFNPGDYESIEMFTITVNHNFDIFPVCPYCGEDYEEHPAISREDNKTEICPNCGIGEAFIDFCDNYKKTTNQ